MWDNNQQIRAILTGKVTATFIMNVEQRPPLLLGVLYMPSRYCTCPQIAVATRYQRSRSSAFNYFLDVQVSTSDNQDINVGTKIDSFVYNTIAQWYNEDAAAAGSNDTLPAAPSGPQPPPQNSEPKTFLGIRLEWNNPVFIAVSWLSLGKLSEPDTQKSFLSLWLHLGHRHSCLCMMTCRALQSMPMPPRGGPS
jgi:hypothetical protein